MLLAHVTVIQTQYLCITQLTIKHDILNTERVCQLNLSPKLRGMVFYNIIQGMGTYTKQKKLNGHLSVVVINKDGCLVNTGGLPTRRVQIYNKLYIHRRIIYYVIMIYF